MCNRPEAYIQSKDAAWASINTTFDVEELKLFCQDVERLFRINPMLNFRKWQVLGPHCYRFSGQNVSQTVPFDFDLVMTVRQINDGVKIDYQHGLKTSTFVIIEPVEGNAPWRTRLTIIDNYNAASQRVQRQQLHTVDKSITVWAEHLQRYLHSWQQWSHIGPWRWYMQKVWQPMKPAGRRITYILLWVAGVEFSLILFGMVIYYLENR
jgi:hypothetical protein